MYIVELLHKWSVTSGFLMYLPSIQLRYSLVTLQPRNFDATCSMCSTGSPSRSGSYSRCCPSLAVSTGPCPGLLAWAVLFHPMYQRSQLYFLSGMRGCFLSTLPVLPHDRTCLLSGRPLCEEQASIGTAIAPQGPFWHSTLSLKLLFLTMRGSRTLLSSNFEEVPYISS